MTVPCALPQPTTPGPSRLQPSKPSPTFLFRRPFLRAICGLRLRWARRRPGKWLSLHSFLLFALRCVFARNVCENEFISFYRSCPCRVSDIKESHRLFPMLFFLVLDGCFTLCEHFFNIIFNIFNVSFFIITSNGIIL